MQENVAYRMHRKYCVAVQNSLSNKKIIGEGIICGNDFKLRNKDTHRVGTADNKPTASECVNVDCVQHYIGIIGRLHQ